MPRTNPSHCRAVTVSRRSQLPSTAVSTGCMPVTSADTPAGMPWCSEAKTPPRYPAWRSAPLTAMCPARLGDGQGAWNSQHSGNRMARTKRNRKLKENNGICVREP